MTHAIPDAVDEREIVPFNEGVPTQVANPKRATLRTAIAALVGLVLTLNPVLVVIIEVLKSIEGTFVVPPVIYAILNGSILIIAAVISGVTRILATPGVNLWVTRYLPWLAAIKPAP